MGPVRVKVYGLFSRTKGQYVRQQVLAVLLMIPLLAIWIYWRVQVVPDFTGRKLPGHIGALMGLIDQIPWAVGLLLAAIVLETFLVLRIFARKEAEQRAAQAPAEPMKKAATESVESSPEESAPRDPG